MRLVIAVSTINTLALAAASHFGVTAQLVSVMLASMVGASLAVYVVRSPRFENLKLSSVMSLAVVLTMLALLGNPILEDDYYRYLWDAFRFASDGTPYGVAPSAFFDDATVPPMFQNILNFINYPDIATIYGPVLQAFFLVGYAIAPGSVFALQSLNAVIVLATLLLLARCGAKPRWLLLYAVSPLVLKESVMTAHPDALTGLLALAAFAICGGRWLWVGGATLGLAVASKVSAGILVPFLWVRGGPRASAAFIGILIVCYLPFFLLAGSDMTSLANFAQNWHFNPLLYAVLESVAGPHVGRVLAAIAIVAIAASLYWRDARVVFPRPKIPPADVVLGALLLFSPVVNPWYLLWLLPFAVLRPSRIVWAATFILPLSYFNGTNWLTSSGQAFDVNVIVMAVEMVALAVAAVFDWVRPLAVVTNEIAVPKAKQCAA